MANPPASESCIFCRIVKGDLPCVRIYEDGRILAFLDINPVSMGHTLVIPKGHYATVLDLPEDLAGPLLTAVARVGGALMAGTGAGGFNCLQNNFSASGQLVHHAHWHVIPRVDGDGLSHWPHRPADTASLQSAAEAIRNHL